MPYSEEYLFKQQYDRELKAARRWAKVRLKTQFLILDTETTGLYDDAEAVQIAIINSRGDRIFESLIKPLYPIQPAASAIHGITDVMVENAPSFINIYSQLKSILESKKVLIYNAAFDKRILRQQAKMNNLPEIDFKSECVMGWYSQYYGDWSEWHDSYTWQRLPGGDHSAIGDCRATLAVIEKMAGKHGY